MNTKVALGIFAIAAMFASSASAAEILDDGTYFFTSPQNGKGVEKLVIKLTRQSGKGALGDGIYHIEETSLYNGYLSAGSSNSGTSVSFGSKTPTKWVLHKNGGASKFDNHNWSIMHAGDEANTVSKLKDGVKYELQRNQGYAHQLWMISKP